MRSTNAVAHSTCRLIGESAQTENCQAEHQTAPTNKKPGSMQREYTRPRQASLMEAASGRMRWRWSFRADSNHFSE
jgi:hypothetical protein